MTVRRGRGQGCQVWKGNTHLTCKQKGSVKKAQSKYMKRAYWSCAVAGRWGQHWNHVMSGKSAANLNTRMREAVFCLSMTAVFKVYGPKRLFPPLWTEHFCRTMVKKGLADNYTLSAPTFFDPSQRGLRIILDAEGSWVPLLSGFTTLPAALVRGQLINCLYVFGTWIIVTCT